MTKAKTKININGKTGKLNRAQLDEAAGYNTLPVQVPVGRDRGSKLDRLTAGKFSFFLAPGTSANTTVRLRYTVASKSVSVGTGIKVPRKCWDKDAQKVSARGTGISVELANHLNDQLRIVINRLEGTHARRLAKGSVFNQSIVKAIIEGNFNIQPDAKGTPIVDLFSDYINSRDLAENTVKTYQNTARLMAEYAASPYVHSKGLAETFTPSQFRDFVGYLKKQGHINSYINIATTHLKTVLKWAHRNDLIKDQHYLKFDKIKVIKTSQVIFLDRGELTRFAKIQIKEEGHRHAQAMFVFQAETGIRFSDLHKVNSGTTHGGNLTIHTQKTDDFLIIPLSPLARKVADQYPDGFPQMAHCVYLDRIREIAKRADIGRPITTIERIAGKQVVKTQYKWQTIGTHTARRTFICLALQAGIPPHIIQRATGHKDIRTLHRYVGAVQEEVQDQFRQYFNSQE